MFLESLDKIEPKGPPLDIQPLELSQPIVHKSQDIRSKLNDRAAQIMVDMEIPKRKVQISKTVEYPPDFTPSLKLIKTRYMGVWKYPDNLDTCAICRGGLAALCVNCDSNLANAHDCTVQWGTCKHAYHKHCISKWIEQRNACPICQQEWIMLEEESPLK